MITKLQKVPDSFYLRPIYAYSLVKMLAERAERRLEVAA